MVEKQVRINAKSGLHMRPAGALCTKAQEFKSRITFVFREREFNAKSLLSTLSACVQEAGEINLRCEGPDEEEALETLSKMIEEL